MKNQLKYLVAFLFMLSVGSHASAQLDIQAGINNSSLSFNIDGISLGTGSVIGFHAGANYMSKVGNSLYIVPGVLLSQKGASFDFDFGLGSTEAKLSSMYLDIPIMLHYQSNAEKGFFIQGGPNLGFLLSASSEGEDVKEGYNSLELALGVGAGYDLGQFKLGLRMNIGLSNIAADTEGEDGSVNHRVLQIFGAYKL